MATSASPSHTEWQKFTSGAVNAFHAYATWLVSISWKRFALLALLLMVMAGVMSDLVSWTVDEVRHRSVVIDAPRAPKTPKAPAEPAKPALPAIPGVRIEGSASDTEAAGGDSGGLDITIGPGGVRIRPRSEVHAAQSATSAAAASAAAAAASAAHIGVSIDSAGLVVQIPPGADSAEVRQAIEEARDSIREAIDAAKDAAVDAKDAAEDAAAAVRDAAASEHDAALIAAGEPVTTTRTVRLFNSLPQIAFFWIVASIILKITYKGRIQAEVKAAQAVETAEAESLKRQVVEARMAAMQAQVEPHFLFNTLASIDHLIETDPARASLMQKNLITLLRASMPTMREASDGGARALGRELAVIKPYLEILKVRMEERLTTEIAVPDGLLSAAFPPMMIQTLVENAVKHGLEPKPEGGHLKVSAEVVHGKLAVTVADTGVGFGKAATAGTGVGLANIRERLQLLYGAQATMAVQENTPTGTMIKITIPYVSIEGARA